MSTIVCNTKFKLDSFADGGSKRSVQIRQWYEGQGLSYVEDTFVLPKNLGARQLVELALRAVCFVWNHYPQKVCGLSSYIALIKYYALRIPIVYDKYKDKDVIFSWENTNDRNMLYLMKATGHKVIGLPHNIESLVRSHSVESLRDEVENLKHCDVVFTIAKEEAWLLRLLGLNAHYLPYYPPREAVAYFETVRKKREKRSTNEQKHFLLLGSATNFPTRDGMQTLVNYAAKSDMDFQLSVAGYGTESLRKFQHPNIHFLGTLSTESLELLLENVDALLIYQPPTTGSLTRIPEMLIAGIPIFVNFDAARDYHHVEDVVEYSSLEDLFARLEDFVPHQAKRLERNEVTEKEFMDICKGFAGK